MLDIQDVAERHLCCGCGVCAYLRPESVEMVDTLDGGRRPWIRPGTPQKDLLAACPGHGVHHEPSTARQLSRDRIGRAWGPVLEVWEGHAGDATLRFEASSGGAATALLRVVTPRAIRAS